MEIYKDLVIWPRCDTEQNWNIFNPVLKEDEFIVVAIDKITTKYKIGDGAHKYNELPFRTFRYCLKFGCLYGQIKDREHLKFKVKVQLINPNVLKEL